MSDTVSFVAAVARVQTLADGGLRVTLDLPEDAVMAAAELMAFKRFGVVMDVVCTQHERDADGTDESRKIKF